MKHGIYPGPAFFTISDNNPDIPLDKFLNPIRDIFTYIGKKNELYFDFIPVGSEDIETAAGDKLIRSLRHFWENRDGVSVEYYDRREIS